MVEAWPMAFRVLGAGVLGSRPSVPAQQAFYAGAAPTLPYAVTPPAPPPPGSAPTPDVWNHQTMLAALANSGVPPSGPQATEWFLDTGATSHMASNTGTLSHSFPTSYSSPITVGNGATLPVTHHAPTTISTEHSLLRLNNILPIPCSRAPALASSNPTLVMPSPRLRPLFQLLMPPFLLCQPRFAQRFVTPTGTAPWNMSSVPFRATERGG